MMRLLLILVAVSVPVALEKKVGYSHPEFLVESAELAKNPGRFTIIDTRPKAQYEISHIPGAVWLDLQRWEKAFLADNDGSTWQKLIGNLGIDGNGPVVIYDDSLSKDASRVWWILRYWGIRNVSILNGGWKTWSQSDFPTNKDIPTIKPVSPQLKPEKERLAVKQTVLDNLKSVQIVDARSQLEYCGLKEMAKRNGSIPGARQLEWSDLLDKKTGRFKSASEMQSLFEQAGIDPTQPTITYCQSGGRASVMAFSLELFGGRVSRNYYWSWSEWGNSEDTPVAKPDKK